MEKTTYSNTVKRFRCFKVKYLPCTNFKGSRVSISDERGIKPSERVNGVNKRKTKIISYNHEFNNCTDIALNYLESIGIKISGFTSSEIDQCDYLLTTNFEKELS